MTRYKEGRWMRILRQWFMCQIWAISVYLRESLVLPRLATNIIHSQAWPSTLDHLASASQILGLPDYSMTPTSHCLLLEHNPFICYIVFVCCCLFVFDTGILCVASFFFFHFFQLPLKKKRLIFLCVFVICECLWRPEKNIRSPRAGVTGSYEPPIGL